MAWNDAFKYVKGIASKHGVTSETPPEDQGLPLAARIGSVLNMQKTPFIHASTHGSLMPIPEENDSIIKAISRINLDMSGSLYRYYLATGDDGNPEKFLQVYQNEQREVSEIMYCSRLTRIIPETEEDQDAYLGSAGYGLGDKTYTVWREQLADLGWDQMDLDNVFGDSDSIEFMRDAGDPSKEFVTPFKGTETRIDDRAGMHGLKQQVVFMPYVRDLAGKPEFLLITTEIISEQDGDRSKRGIHVDFMIGIPLSLDRVSIQ